MYEYIKSKSCNPKPPILEITVSSTDANLLKETNLFNKNDIISFCVFASYGDISNLEDLKVKKVGNYINDIEKDIKLLNSKIENYKSVRIWYSSIDSEEMCTMYFLIFYLRNLKNIKIYLCDVYDEYCHYRLGTYQIDEIKDLLSNTTLLDFNNRKFYEEEWIKLKNENSDLRIIENKSIASKSFDFLDSKILKSLKENNEISYNKFVIKCLSNNLCNFHYDIFFIDRIDYLISKGNIEICSIKNEKDITGDFEDVQYIKIKKEGDI